MKHLLIHKLHRRTDLPSSRDSNERRWELRIHYLMWTLAVVCLVMSALVWRRLLSGL